MSSQQPWENTLRPRPWWEIPPQHPPKLKEHHSIIPATHEAMSLAVAALEREAKAEPVATMPPDEWVRDYAKKHCSVKTGEHWKADAWNLKCAFRAWAEASPPAPETT